MAETLQKTIVQIRPGDGEGYRTFDYTKGPQAGKKGASVDVVFDDGSEGSYTTKPDFALKHVAALMKLQNTLSEFELEARDPFNNIPQWKIKQYPGNPAKQVDEGSDRGSKRGDWETAEERAAKNRSIIAQVAVKGAVRLVSNDERTADQKLQWVLTAAAQLADTMHELASEAPKPPTQAPDVAAKVPAPQGDLRQWPND